MTDKIVNEIINPDDDVVSIPRNVLANTTLVVKPEKIVKTKEKKPRTKAQLEATARMREALALRRSGGKTEYGATVHSDEYKKSLDDAQDVADKLALTTGIKTVVKKPAGRPRGSRVVKEAPTPHVQSDEEEEEEEEEEYIPPPVKKAIKNIIRQQNQPQPVRKVVEQRPLSYLERLNIHLR